ncbi:hypothetical protein IEO21_04230 [Rhodonia placenta]|uniref:C2H2-type domain-containing protein n=1 Tax=Rhodonia placenta TaxID=104341 RepID=A0A8H7P4J9_9APHY|nr:hypothetical protein IEO21_04230 [Postia placenta]
MSADASGSIVCCWGSPICGVTLNDTTPAGIARHLRNYHFPVGQWHNRLRGTCQWRYAGTVPCDREMFQGNFGKHIATVHLRVLETPCPRCRQMFVRPDAVLRHLVSGHCPNF